MRFLNKIFGFFKKETYQLMVTEPVESENEGWSNESIKYMLSDMVKTDMLDPSVMLNDINNEEKAKTAKELFYSAKEYLQKGKIDLYISNLEQAIKILSELPLQEDLPIYSVYNDAAITIGHYGEKLRQSGNFDEALHKDLIAIEYLEKAIKYESTPENNKKKYKEDLIKACIYIAADLLRKKDIYKSIEICEKICFYAKDVKSTEINQAIISLADNFNRLLNKIEMNFGIEGKNEAVAIAKKMNDCARLTK